jgi:hypothetical protein
MATVGSVAGAPETSSVDPLRKTDLAPASPQRSDCISLAAAGHYTAAIRPCLAALAIDPGDPEVQGAVRKIQAAMSDGTAAPRRAAAAKPAAPVGATDDDAVAGSAPTAHESITEMAAEAAGEARTPDAAAAAARQIAEKLAALRAAEDEAAKRALGR